jgi:hypothetical protein
VLSRKPTVPHSLQVLVYGHREWKIGSTVAFYLAEFEVQTVLGDMQLSGMNVRPIGL